MKRSTRILAAGLFAASSMLLAACTNGSSGGGGGAVVRLATGVDASYTAVYVAAEKGYFKDRGVNVQYSTLEGGPAMAQAVIAGQADMATQSDATTTTMMGTDPALRALLDFQHSDTYIKVVWGPKVKDPSDIKKLAILPGLMKLATVRYLESKGIDADKVTLSTATPPDIPVMLKRGDVDATVIYEPWATRSAEESGGKIVGSIGDFGVSYSQWLITDEEWLKGHKDEAAKVAAALDDANKFIREHPEEAQKIVQKAVKIPTDQTAQIMKDLVFETRDLDESTVKRATDTAQFFVDDGAMKAVPDLKQQILTNWWSQQRP